MRYDGTRIGQLTDNQWEDSTAAWQLTEARQVALKKQRLHERDVVIEKKPKGQTRKRRTDHCFPVYADPGGSRNGSTAMRS
jgi:hypothetical protein